jgi:demethylmenaquinone methyltransferase/2-methoxy-6-polyprenyl-1,4-benzoquinol methylase
MPYQLPTSEEKAGYVLNQFNRIAYGYDLTNDAISFGMHRLWKQAAIDALNTKLDGSYLDVCCGTGDLSLSMAERLSSSGNVVGLDFSENMLAVAHQRANQKRLARSGKREMANIEWIRADAEHLPFDDGLFDGAIISFGLRNLTDLGRGLSEMARVVRPGGHVVNLDLGRSTIPLFSSAFKLYFRQIVPLIGLLLQKDRQAYTYLPESLTNYPNPDEISKLFGTAGLTEVRHVPLAMGSVALHVGVVKGHSNEA